MLQGVVHLCSFLGCDIRDSGIFEDAAIEEVHDVEVGANDLFVLTET